MDFLRPVLELLCPNLSRRESEKRPRHAFHFRDVYVFSRQGQRQRHFCLPLRQARARDDESDSEDSEGCWKGSGKEWSVVKCSVKPFVQLRGMSCAEDSEEESIPKALRSFRGAAESLRVFEAVYSSRPTMA